MCIPIIRKSFLLIPFNITVGHSSLRGGAVNKLIAVSYVVTLHRFSSSPFYLHRHFNIILIILFLSLLSRQ